MRSMHWVLLLVAVAVANGCSDSTGPNNTGSSSIGLLQGQIGDADFEITVDAAGDSLNPMEGPFTLRGFNLHYVDSLSALVVDLTITNGGETAHPEPVGLTFLKLLPAGVTVLNNDNGIEGEGAAIEFSFANDDSLWTANETSLPRNVHFGVAKGTSVGFVARLDVGAPLNGGGTISGRVWNDADKDGVIDPDEVGIGGAGIVLSGAGDDTLVTDQEASTDDDGYYAFDGLSAGVYTVSKSTGNGLTPTTPSEITVLLTEVDGTVSDFTEANFGCVTSGGDSTLLVGVFVQVVGEYLPDPHRIEAEGVVLRRCATDRLAPTHYDDEDDDDDDEDDDGGGGDGGVNCAIGTLRGPVTDIDAANYTFAVMGTWVTTSETRFPDALKVGNRLDIRVYRKADGDLFAYSIRGWDKSHEEVRGLVDEISVEDGTITLRVLNTLVTVSPQVNPYSQ